MNIIVFDERGSSRLKVAGISLYCPEITIIDVISLEPPYIDFIDSPEDFIGDVPVNNVNICLNFVLQPDVSQYLTDIYRRRNVPVVASGQRIIGAFTPFTCCGLGEHSSLGIYAKRFGIPKIEVSLGGDGRIEDIKVIKGAPCGLTWQKAEMLIGMSPDEAIPLYGRLIQYDCVAPPSSFDPITGKSRLHYAADVHINALKQAIKRGL